MCLAEELERLLPASVAGVIPAFLGSLPPRYQECFPVSDIAQHMLLLEQIGARDPLRVIARPRADGRAECTLLSFDHPALFSLIAGILSSHSFDIESGDVFTTSAGGGEVRGPLSGGPTERPPRGRLPGGRTPRRGAHGRSPVVHRRGVAEGELAVRRRIIDRFVGRVRGGLSLSRWVEGVEQALRDILLLLEEATEGSASRARAKVNDMVAAALASLRLDVTRGLYPVDIEIDNERVEMTALRVVSEDTPFFLYAFSGALSLHHLSIDSVRIRTEGSRIHDEFGIVGIGGGRVDDPRLLDKLRLSALLTKQFSYFLANAPDPTAALTRFEELVEQAFPTGERERWTRYLSDPRALQNLARLLGASDFLWEDFLRRQYEALLPILGRQEGAGREADASAGVSGRLRARLASARGYEATIDALNEFKDAEIFAYDVDHILAPAAGHAELGRRLTRLAEAVVAAAAELAYSRLASSHGVPRTIAGLEVPWAVMGLGKLGGEALGYASDIELLLVFQDNGRTDGARGLENGEFFGLVARELGAAIRAKREGIFSVDLRLRPYGSSGQAACSMESFCRYYARDGDARAYERLALVCMRPVAGDPEFGARLERVRDELLYVSGAVDLEELRRLRARQAQEKDAIRRANAKFSPGALVDLEYTVQILQLKYGHDHPALRTPRIREALAALKQVGVLEPAEAERLAEAYGFLRALINALRMLRGSALDLYVPDPGSEEYVHLARRMGYGAGGDPARQLHLDLQTYTAEVRSFLQRHFGEQSLLAGEVGSCADLVLSDGVPRALRDRILHEAGFRDAERSYRNLRGLAGPAGTRRTFARVAVLAADMLRRKPDADMALNNWERFMARIDGWEGQYGRLLSQPTRLDVLLSVFASSQYLSDTLIGQPEIFDWLAEPVAAGRVRDRADMEADFDAVLAEARSSAERSAALRSFKRRELARIGTKDICLGAPLEEVCFEISELADALLGRVLAWVAAESGCGEGCHLVLLAFGKLGGRELNYSSDVDLVGVYDGDPARGQCLSTALERLRRELGSHTDAGYAYRVDFRLRPYGSSGELATSARALLSYYEKTASLWELQASLRARPVGGDPQAGESLVRAIRGIVVARVGEIVRQPGGRSRIATGMRHMRLAGSRSGGRLSRLSRDVKNGTGGIRDVELLVQGMALIWCREHPELVQGNTLLGLQASAEAGLIDRDRAKALREAYVFLRKVEHYLQVFDDRQTHTLPAEEGRLEHLARCLLGHDATGPSFLRRLDETGSIVRAELERFLGSVA